MPPRAPQDGRYLTRELFWSEHAALVARIDTLERLARELAGAEHIHQELTARIARLEQETEERWKNQQESADTRKTRIWQAVLAVVTGLVLPLGVLGILALVHLSGR
jgi:hypothetical protein